MSHMRRNRQQFNARYGTFITSESDSPICTVTVTGVSLSDTSSTLPVSSRPKSSTTPAPLHPASFTIAATLNSRAAHQSSRYRSRPRPHTAPEFRSPESVYTPDIQKIHMLTSHTAPPRSTETVPLNSMPPILCTAATSRIVERRPLPTIRCRSRSSLLVADQRHCNAIHPLRLSHHVFTTTTCRKVLPQQRASTPAHHPAPTHCRFNRNRVHA